MRYHIYIDKAVRDASNDLAEAKELFEEYAQEATDNNYPVRVTLKDMESFEELACS